MRDMLTSLVVTLALVAPAHAFVVGPDTGAVGDLPLSAHDTPRPAVVPSRLVVKYAEAVDACAHCLFAHGHAFATVTGSATLDHLNQKYRVRAARPMFFHRHGLSGAQARAAFRTRLENVHRRFPRRAARARPLAEVPDLTNVYELELARNADVERAAAEYAADPGVVYAHPVYIVQADLSPNDPYFASSGTWGQSYADLWGLHEIDAASAWDTTTGAGTVVAVVDTGVDSGHLDLAANLWSNAGEIAGNGVDDDGNGFVDDLRGWDFHYGDNDPRDRHGHGTHVAGTVAAVGNNAEGVVGVAWNARIMPVQGLSDEGFGFSSRLGEAMLYAAENGADVINNSWGGFGLSRDIYEALAAADALGTVVVSAAGNSAANIDNLLWLPAGHPQGLTVGALTPGGALAGFSNYGERLSVVAPGVDVLSLRAAQETLGASGRVGQRYIRLSGTSMASPHAAGAAALVLAANPGLTTEEVRWRIELGANQPGHPGYEGERHNPIFGFGRLDAAAAFAPPPVTTRLDPPNIREWHAFADAVEPVPGEPGRFHFTALAPVAWSVSAPPWLAPATPAGAGAAALDLASDTSGLAPGTYVGDVTLSAPGAVDGGASFSAQLDVHDDLRVGAPVVVATEAYGTILGYEPASTSNGLTTLTAWQGNDGRSHYSLVDGAGAVSAPGQLGERFQGYDLAAASDGHDFLLGWVDLYFDEENIRIARFAADGALRDRPSVPVLARREKPCQYLELAGAGFDGTDYWLGLVEQRYCGFGRSTLYVLRVRRDGSFGKRTRITALPTSIRAVFGCRAGGCLFAWMDRRVELVEATGKYIRSAYALPVVGERAASGAKKVVTDMFGFTGLATDGQDFFGLSQRYFFCAPGDLCRTEVIGVRMSASGDPLDPDALVVSNAPVVERVYPWPGGVAFDGSGWVASYQKLAVADSPFECGSYLFVNRLDAAGTPQSSEHIGWLLDAGGRASESLVTATATGSLVTWEDGRGDPLEPVYPHPAFSRLPTQRVFTHAPDASFEEREIGTIGSTAVLEGERLRFRVTASGLDPESTSFTASGLPPGALFDAERRLFQWRPGATEAGTAASVLLTATAGATVVSETVELTVVEQIPSITGLVRLGNGSPVAGAVLTVKGTDDRHRTITTNDQGRYRIEGHFSAGRPVSLKLARPTSREYRAEPRSVGLVAAPGDQPAPDMVVAPR